MSFSFACATCGKEHVGMPSFGADAPLSYYGVPAAEREARCELGSDDCVIDEQYFFVRGCIEIPVQDAAEPFIWGVWASLSEANFREWAEVFGEQRRSHVGPFFGWLDAWLKPYPETMNLKTMVHLRDNGIRPYIEIEPTDHPLAVEQRSGIDTARVAEIYSIMVHAGGAETCSHV
jgi:hypothetical protein